jgi:hypothetical protein
MTIRRFAGIGSRKAPPHMLDLMFQLGYHLCGAGWELSGADALGSDQAFQNGVRANPRVAEVGFKLYMPGLDRDRFAHNPEQGIYNAKLMPNYAQAQQLAYEARRSFEGLNEAGIALHSRNPYQILGPNLNEPVATMVFYAEPTANGRAVHGGTNTAYQIALAHNVPTINLFTPDGLERAENFLRQLMAA